MRKRARWSILQRNDPSAALRPQNLDDWTGEYPLPAAVATYYAELGPDDVSIRGYGNGYFLPSLACLWAYQTGYHTHGHTGEHLSDWDEDWLVVGDEGADPFIFSREHGTVLRAYHSEGKWEPQELFRDLDVFARFVDSQEVTELVAPCVPCGPCWNGVSPSRCSTRHQCPSWPSLDG